MYVTLICLLGFVGRFLFSFLSFSIVSMLIFSMPEFSYGIIHLCNFGLLFSVVGQNKFAVNASISRVP